MNIQIVLSSEMDSPDFLKNSLIALAGVIETGTKTEPAAKAPNPGLTTIAAQKKAAKEEKAKTDPLLTVPVVPVASNIVKVDTGFVAQPIEEVTMTMPGAEPIVLKAVPASGQTGASTELTREMVRAATNPKIAATNPNVATSKPAVAALLKSFGVASVTTLDPKDFESFLAQLILIP